LAEPALPCLFFVLELFAGHSKMIWFFVTLAAEVEPANTSDSIFRHMYCSIPIKYK
jgi:hypothetical protein